MRSIEIPFVKVVISLCILNMKHILQVVSITLLFFSPLATSAQSAGLPAGVTLQAIDGETMLTSTTMSNNYYTRNGFNLATDTSWGAQSWDDPNFFPLAAFYGIYIDQVASFKDIGFNTSISVTGDTPPAFLMTNKIWAAPTVNGTTTTEIALNRATPGIHMDEVNPTSYIRAFPNSSQDGRFWDLTGTWNTFAFGDIGGVPMYRVLAADQYTTPNGTKRSVNSFSVDVYFFASQNRTTGRDQAAGVAWNTSSPPGRVGLTVDQMKRGSNYGNMIDTFRGWGNGTLQAPGFSTSGATSRIPFFALVENGDGLVGTGSVLITPPEYNWAVWSSIIHGARGLNSFVSVDKHFGGFSRSIVSGQTISMYDQGKATHTQVKSLAAVINSPFALGYVTVTPSGYVFPVAQTNPFNGGIELCVHWYQNKFYIFATTRNSETVTNTSATFTINANASATSVTVLNESRTIPVTGHQFTDTFANAWTVHIYQVN